MCQPGKPLPHGLSHSICRFSPGGENFHSAKSVGLALLAELDALAGFEPVDVEAREIAVVGLLRRVEVDAVGRAVRVAVALDVGDERDLLGDVVGRAAQDVGSSMLSALHVGEERVGVELRDLPRRLAGAPRALLHLVLAGVGVGREVADVGDVHHVADAIAVPAQHALQHVLEQERAEVADVLVVVDGRPAGVQADRCRPAASGSNGRSVRV